MPNGGIEQYTYDAAGRQTAKTDALNSTIQYTYDARDRLAGRSYPDGSITKFSYNNAGNRISAKDIRGLTSYAFDARNRLTNHTYPDGKAIDYTYDTNGRLKTIATAAGTVTYNYTSCCGRLQSVTDQSGNTTTFAYDPAGNRTGLTYPNGTGVSYTYDTNNRLTNLTHNKGAQTIASYAYTLGPTGNRTKIDEANGISRVYNYDKLYRLTKEQVTDANNIQTYTSDYVYDAVGNRTAKTQTATSTATNSYTYNNADQLITEDGITYTYDLNGNLKTKTDATGTTTYSYNYEQKLIKVEAPASTTTYQYDADGNKVEATTGTQTTKYLVDANRSLAQVAAEYTTTGTITASYVYADDIISMTRNSQTYYYHFDGLGSTRLLTDSTGTVTDTYDYDAFGSLINRTGTTENAFLFTGQQYDANIGFYYLRARLYQPATGRFMSYDPIEGDIYTPSSLHKYLYTANDPVNKIDPSGAFSLVEMSAAESIRSVLVDMQASFGFSLMSAAEESYDEVMVGLAIGLAIPLVGITVKFLTKSAKQTIQSGGWLRHHEGIGVPGAGEVSHTISKHVGQTELYLRSRDISKASTFYDTKEAELAISTFVKENRTGIRGWIKSKSTTPFEGVYEGNKNIGFGIYRSNGNVVHTNKAKVVLRKRDRGYVVYTAYPDI